MKCIETLTSGLARLSAVRLKVGVYEVQRSDGWKPGDLGQ